MREGQVSKALKNRERSAGRITQMRPTGGQRAMSGSRKAGGGSARKKSKSRVPNPLGSAADARRSGLPIANPEIYRPLKKPITLRVDADVLAWFKKDGRRYQTRINQALRQVMEREMKGRK